MNSLKPYQMIASRFQISQESARYFLDRVQKSFKKERPPHALILEFIQTQGIEVQPDPYDVALLMHAEGTWPHELNSAPPIFVDDV